MKVLQPIPAVVGQRYPRDQWAAMSEEFSAQFCERMPNGGLRHVGAKDDEGRDFLVHLNYRCHGPYGPKQEVEFLGYIVTVWAKGGMAFEHESVPTCAQVYPAIERLAAKADARCKHPHAKQTGYSMCLTSYHCPDCGVNFDIDSSG